MRMKENGPIRVLVWNEFVHEREYEGIARIYPKGIHEAIRDFLQTDENLVVRTATLDMPEHGLTEEVLQETDVLIWWGHAHHEDVDDAVVERACRHVLLGMGFIGLHSAHMCKPMRRLLGTTMTLNYREGDSEKLFITAPEHPIAAGVAPVIELMEEELYGEFFDIPKPDDVIFTGWFAGGAVFRSGVTWTRGLGKIFYFQPGHESYPIYYHPEIQKVITNAVYYTAPTRREMQLPTCKPV